MGLLLRVPSCTEPVQEGNMRVNPEPVLQHLCTHAKSPPVTLRLCPAAPYGAVGIPQGSVASMVLISMLVHQ